MVDLINTLLIAMNLLRSKVHVGRLFMVYSMFAKSIFSSQKEYIAYIIIIIKKKRKKKIVAVLN